MAVTVIFKFEVSNSLNLIHLHLYSGFLKPSQQSNISHKVISSTSFSNLQFPRIHHPRLKENASTSRMYEGERSTNPLKNLNSLLWITNGYRHDHGIVVIGEWPPRMEVAESVPFRIPISLSWQFRTLKECLSWCSELMSEVSSHETLLEVDIFWIRFRFL